MNAKPQRWIPLATAGLGILAAILATPLLFPTPVGAKGETPAPAAAKAKTTAPITGSDADLARLGGVLVSVAGAGAAALWLVRRVKGKAFGRRQGKALEILDTLQLGNQRSVAVARVYDRVYILGLAKESVSLIRELNEDELGLDMEAVARRDRDVKPAGGAQPPFRSLLKKLTTPGAQAAGAREVEVAAVPRRAPNRRVTIAELERMEREHVEELL